MAIDEAKLNQFLGKALGDLGAAISSTLVLVGDRGSAHLAPLEWCLVAQRLNDCDVRDERHRRVLDLQRHTFPKSSDRPAQVDG